MKRAPKLISNTQTIQSPEKVALFDIDHTLFDTQTFWDTNFQEYRLHTEVKDILLELKKHAVLGIFSEGELDFQKEKLLKTGIFDFFITEHTYIVPKGKKVESMKAILKNYVGKKTFFIDDRLEFLYHARDFLPSIQTIWVKRGYYSDKQVRLQGFEPDSAVRDIREAAEFIMRD